MSAGPLMLDLESTRISDRERRLLRRPGVGGVILFSRNYESPEQLFQLTSEIRRIRPQLLIAVDHEGGRVQRFRDGFTRIPPMALLGQLWQQDPGQGLELAHDCGWLFASELQAYGIDISFAPVLDIDCGISEVIGDRSFGTSADAVIEIAAALMSGMQQAGMATTGKHFPGHGSVAADSHHEMPVDPRPFEQIRDLDLKPFSRFAKAQPGEAGALMDAVMPAHVVYSSCDEQPAGFSEFWLQQVLRKQLGFDGVIFSDDLSMAGAELAGSYPERAQAALQAGCDMVLVCNQPQAALEVLDWLEQQGHTEAPRVKRMKSSQMLSLEQLQGSGRWQRCRQQLQALMEESA